MTLLALVVVFTVVMLLGCAWALCRAAARGEWPVERSEYVDSTWLTGWWRVKR